MIRYWYPRSWWELVGGIAVFALIALIFLAALADPGDSGRPQRACRGHGGVVRFKDRPNGGPDVYVCRDGSIGQLP